MTPHIAEIWRHPIKAHGRERVEQVTLTPGQAIPYDRRWAVAHERSGFDTGRPGWNPPGDFSRGASAPRLQQIECRTDAENRTITFSHPDRPDITLDPDDHGDACDFVQWVVPISNDTRALPARLVRAPDAAMTDTAYQSISLINLASHAAIATQLGHDISPLRWRGNLLVAGLDPWAEMGWVGKTLRLGEVEFEVIEPIKRCRMTEANPKTGIRDTNTLGALRDGFGHQFCGIYVKVRKGGLLTEGAMIEVLT